MQRVKRQTRDPLSEPWGARTPYSGAGRWPERVDERVLEEAVEWVSSVCGLCAHGCAVDLGTAGGKIVAARGRADGAANKGRLGPKGLHAWDATVSDARLTRPLIRRHGKFREATWEEALELVADRMSELARHFTPGTIGFYAGGDLSLEEQYALCMVAKGGLGTPHVDTSATLYSASGAAALRETFGCDGQPGRFDDLDVADCLLLVGHDMAASHSVLWSRVLDRRQGAKPPSLVVIDPVTTATAAEADVHLAPRAGTMVALLNGLIRQIDELGGVDAGFVARSTSGFDALMRAAAEYPPERVEQLCGVPRDRLREAARRLCEAKALTSTVHLGVYQSHQATAAACQVNNINLLRGMIGKKGAGVLQMEELPNGCGLRETGLAAPLPAFLDASEPDHVEKVAQAWNVEPERIPTWTEPTTAVELLRLAELGSLRMLFVSGCNPAVSWPDLHRVRRALASPSLFLVVCDAFLSETAQLADVVLPTAAWGEKEGTFVSADRGVRLARKAVPAPGQARSDFEIIVELSRRLDLRDRAGKALLPWREPRQAFEAFRELTEGTRCEYGSVDRERLEAGESGRWGPERLYENGVFPTAPGKRQSAPHDIETGARLSDDDASGRARLRPARWLPPPEPVDARYPYALVPGRLIEHARTRQITGRAPALAAASERPFIRISESDARRVGVVEGDLVEVASRRGTVRGPVRVGGIADGQVFIPPHFGYFDKNKTFMRAAHELTAGDCDPVSGQPVLYSAVQVHREGRAPIRERLADFAGKSLERTKELADRVSSQAHFTKAHIADYLLLAVGAHAQLAEACEKVARQHPLDADVRAGLAAAVRLAADGAGALKALAARYGEASSAEPAHLMPASFNVARGGAFGLLRDLHDLLLMATEAEIAVLALRQAALALRDEALVSACAKAQDELSRQKAWLLTQLSRRAAQTLSVPS